MERGLTRRELLAWAAGFMDGEGYFGAIPQKNGRKQLAIKVFQKDRAVLDRLQAIFAVGSIRPVRKLGKFIGHVWVVTKYEHSQLVISSVWEFLSPVKRQQATLALKTMIHYFREERKWRWKGTSKWGVARPGSCLECDKPHYAMGFCRSHYYRDYIRRKKVEAAQ